MKLSQEHSTIRFKVFPIMEGYIHSTESFGTVDGPGIRYVVFLQGCPLRCKYCHNPDTWQVGIGENISAETIIENYNKNKAFYSNGGITVTGGEPLLQIDFLLELFKMAKKEGIHTCIDTSGITYRPMESEYNEKLALLLEYTDLVMLDIKHIDPEVHRELTGQDNGGILAFARYLSEKKVPFWVRHVVVPGITDDPVYLRKLGNFLGTLNGIKALDVLPYHTMGKAKYEEMGIPYPLEGVEALPKSEAVKAKEIILKGFKETRKIP